MNKSSLDKANLIIQSYFSNCQKSILKRKNLKDIFAKMRLDWNLSSSLSANKFIKYLITEKILTQVELNFPNRKETIYVIGKINNYKVLQSINSDGYFSHLTALHLHNLITINPKLIYWNVEQFKKKSGLNSIDQHSITNAFKNKPRVSNNFFEYYGCTIYGINGMFTDNLGVITENNIRYTNIERTLIDVVVRPQYSLGPKTILNAFIKAKRKLDLKQLVNYYKKLKYTYPYHQSIGFFLENAGYPSRYIEPFNKMNMNYDFYLDYNIRNPKYSKKWRLYYPAELDKI